jgi:hypothetical protein
MRLPTIEDPNSHESSPLDDPLNSTYVRVIAIEIVIIILLFIVGRLFQ